MYTSNSTEMEIFLPLHIQPEAVETADITPACLSD